ncbi:MAG: hypothetical protein K0Q72_3591 [Armatimonadetes bacterium]|jgi:glycosyltransferase involved in cell wall biosynthesis|nr:hypothetical protein [Armatimonadota bacterium]
MLELVFLFLSMIGAGFWLGAALVLMHGFSRVPLLEREAPLADAECPRLSIVVPACNEAETVEPAMRSLLALDYPDLEVIAVEDRSTDATGAILDRLATENPRLRVHHIETLPDGWLGKNHALHQGAAQASGEWVLFTDADVVYQPDALRRALGLATRGGWDDLVLYPRIISEGFWERAFNSFFMTIFNVRFRTWEASRPGGGGYVGVGAFNMVRASVYHALGGHERLRMDVADDIHLGKLIKRGGYRQCLGEANQHLRVRWAFGLPGVIHVLTKNAFAGCGYSWGMVLFSIVGLSASAVWPYVGLFVGELTPRLLCATAIGGMVLLQAFWARRGGIPARYALAWPLAVLLFLFIIVRSGILTERQRGIYWRGTFYPLEELRRGMLRG